MDPISPDVAFQVLGLAPDAGEAEVRARYLELVKQFPPERDPEKFRKIQTAYQVAQEPLLIAGSLLIPPDSDDVPSWSGAIEAQKSEPPALSLDLLLSLGNRDTAWLPSQQAPPAGPDLDPPSEEHAAGRAQHSIE